MMKSDRFGGGGESAPDRQFQDSILPGVSRTFSLTIPKLPEALRTSVTNAYLLCRIADTVEDHSHADADTKRELYRRLLAAQEREDRELGRLLAASLDADTPAAELELVRNSDRILRVRAALPEPHRTAISHCLRTVCDGMGRFSALQNPRGLPNLHEFDRYCYVVAGVVGEMLTTLFCEHRPALLRHRKEMMRLAVAFGRGLQTTNILKDLWEDSAAGVCWLPRDVFARHGCMLEVGANWAREPGFQAGIREMVSLAHADLREALRYTLLIPGAEAGIRRFCACAIGMALLTLQRIHRHPGYTSQAQVKISRSQVAHVVAVSNLAVHSDLLLRASFRIASRGLPVSRPTPPFADDGAVSSLPVQPDACRPGVTTRRGGNHLVEAERDEMRPAMSQASRSKTRETVVLVDADDQPVGEAGKLEAHLGNLRHRAISVLIFNSAGHMLLQKRSTRKYHSAGLWSNACCTHPRPGETAAEAARRRLREEMGFTVPLTYAGRTAYEAAVGNQLFENEIVHVFIGHHDGPIAPDTSEVEDYRWSPLETLRADMTKRSQRYKAWFKHYATAPWFSGTVRERDDPVDGPAPFPQEPGVGLARLR